MAKDRIGHLADIVGRHVESAVQDRSGFAAQNKVLTRARASPPSDQLRNELRRAGLLRTRRADKVGGVSENVVRDDHLTDGFLQTQNLPAVEDRRNVDRHVGRRRLHDLDFLGSRRVIHLDMEHEAVLLGFGQRVGALLFNGVLRREHEERFRKHVGGAARGDVVLLHGFQQRRLGLGRRAIDLIREDHVGEQRTGQEGKSPPAGLRVVLQDVRAGNV